VLRQATREVVEAAGDAASPPRAERAAPARVTAGPREPASPPAPVRPSDGRAPMTIRLVTRPQGASVMGGGRSLGKTPLPYTTRVGSTEVLRFTKAGYGPTSRRITASPKTRTIVVQLRRHGRR
jgi:hypothetical protein